MSSRKNSEIDFSKLPKLLSLEQVSDILGVHQNTLRNWDKSGRLPATRIGGRKDRRYETLEVKKLYLSSIRKQKRSAGNKIEKIQKQQPTIFQKALFSLSRVTKPKNFLSASRKNDAFGSWIMENTGSLIVYGVLLLIIFVFSLQNMPLGRLLLARAEQEPVINVKSLPTTCVGWNNPEKALETNALPDTDLVEFLETNSATRSNQEALGDSQDDSASAIRCKSFTLSSDVPNDAELRSASVIFSFAADSFVGSEDVIDFEYAINDQQWKTLDSFALLEDVSNKSHAGYWSYVIPDLTTPDQIKYLSFRAVFNAAPATQATTVYFDGVSLNLEFHKQASTELAQEIEDTSGLTQEDFVASEEPTLSVTIEETSPLALLGVDARKRTIRDVEVIDPAGNVTNVEAEVKTVKKGGDTVAEYTIPKGSLTKGGKYSFALQVEENGFVHTIAQEFTWGVVAVNIRNSVSTPDTFSELAFAVLNNDGVTICDAQLYVTLRHPGSFVEHFSTNDSTVIKNPTCIDKSVTNDPDYSVFFTTTDAGTYDVEVTATTPEGSHTITDSFTVEEKPLFAFERTKFPTRVYPIANYPVSFTVTPTIDYTGAMVEKVPNDFDIFDITERGQEVVQDDDPRYKTIIWPVAFEAGKTYTLGYTFDPPDIAPAFYTLGPASIDGFIESRQWQIAFDSIGVGGAARLWTSGFELQTLTAGEEITATAGTAPTIDTSTKRSGAASLKTDASSATSNATYRFRASDAAGVDDHYIRAYINISTLPGTLVPVMVIQDAGATNQASIRMNTSGTLELWNEEDGVQIGSDSTTALGTGTWYRLELRFDATTIASTILDARIDGVSFASGTVNHANGARDLTIGIVTTTTTATFYWDDIAINDDSGSLDPNWAGPGNVVILKPNGHVTNTCDGSSTGYLSLDEGDPDDVTSYVACDANNDEITVDTDDPPSEIGTNDSITVMQFNARYTRSSAASSSYRVRGIVPSSAGTQLGTTVTDSTTTWSTNTSTDPRVPGLTAFTQTFAFAGSGQIPLVAKSDLTSARISFQCTDSNPLCWVSTLWITVEYVPASHGRMYTSGFELQSATSGMEWTTAAGSPSVQTTTFRSGLAALQINSLSSGTTKSLTQQFKSANNNGPFFARFYFRVDTLPSGNNRIMSFKDSGGTDRAFIELTSTGTLELRDEDGQVGSASSALTVQKWYRIELKLDSSGAGANDTVEAKIDGHAAFATSATRDLTNGVTSIELGGNLNGETQTTGNWYFDDVGINENVGSSQNGYPGVGAVVHMKPNADGDNTAWTNTYTNIDEVTPNDATDAITSTTTSQLEDENFETSASAGIGASDTISVVGVGVRSGLTAANDDFSAIRIRLKDATSSGAGGAPIIESNDINVTTTWSSNDSTAMKLYMLQTVDRPHLNSPWTPSTLDSAQAGVKLTLDGLGDTTGVTTLWLQVDYIPKITVSGFVYSNETPTAYGCNGNTITVRTSTNGDTTTRSGDCTLVTGDYSVTADAAANTGDPVAVFIDNAESISATSVTIVNAVTSNITLNAYQNRVAVASESATAINNSNLAYADNGDSGIRYAVSSGALTTDSNMELHVYTSDTFDPDGTVTTQGTGDLHVDDSGTAYLDTATSTIAQNVTIDTSGTLNVSADATVNGGAGGGVSTAGILNHTAGTFTIGNSTDEDLTLTGGATTLSGGNTVIKDDINHCTAGTLNINAGSNVDVLSTTGVLNMGSGCSASAVLNLAGGSLDVGQHMYLDAGTVTLSGGTHRAGVSTDGIIEVARYANGGMTFNMSGGDIYGRAFIVYNDQTLTTTTVSGGTIHLDDLSGAVASVFFYEWSDDSPKFYSIQIDDDAAFDSTASQQLTYLNGNFVISSGKTFDANGKALTLEGNWTNGGTYTADSNTVTMGGVGGQIDGTNDTTFYNLTIDTTGSLNDVDIETTGTDDPIISNNLNIAANDVLSIEAPRTVTINPAATFTFNGYIDNDGTLIYKSTTAFPTSGSLTNPCIIRFDTSSNNVTMSARTYMNVEVYGNNTSNDVDAAAGTYTVSGTVSMSQGGTGTTDWDLDEFDPVLTVNGAITIGANTRILSSASATIAFKGSITNNGTFVSNAGTLTLSGSTQQTITGGFNGGVGGGFNNVTISNNSGSDPDSSPSVIFTGGDIDINGTLAVNTAGVKIRFPTAYSIIVGGLNLNGSSGAGNQVYLRSDTPGTYAPLGFANLFGQTLTYVDAKDSDASSGTTINATGTGNVNSGNNINWNFGLIRIAGTVYDAVGSSAFNCSGTNLTINVSVNGDATPDVVTCTAADGTFTFNVTKPTAADQLIVMYIDGVETQSATSATLSKSANEDAPMDLYIDYVNIYSASGSVMTNTLLDTFDRGNDTDIDYTVTTGNMTVFTAHGLVVAAGYTPGGTVTTPASSADAGTVNDGGDGDLVVNSGKTLTMAANGLLIGGDLDNNGTISTTAGQAMTFTGTTTGFTIDRGTFSPRNVTFNGSGGGWSFTSSTTLSEDLTLTLGTLSGTNDLAVQGGDITGNGDISLTSGTFSVYNATTFGGNTDWDFNNLTFESNGASDIASTAIGSGSITLKNELILEHIYRIACDCFDGHALAAGPKTWIFSSGGATAPFNNDAGLIGNTSTFRYDADYTQNRTISSANDASTNYYYNLEVYGEDVGELFSNMELESGTTLVKGNLTVGDGAETTYFDTNTFDPTMDIDGNVSCTTGSICNWFVGSGTKTVGGNLNFTNFNLSTITGSTFIMDGSGKTYTSDSETVNNLTLSGTITLANATHIISGNAVFSGTVTAGTSTVSMTGTSNSIQGGSNSLYGFTVDPSSAGTISVVTSGFTVTNTLTVAANDTLSIGSGLTVTWTGSTFSMQATSIISGAGRLTINSATILNETGNISSIVRFDATAGNTTVMPDRPSYGYGGNVEIYSNSTPTTRTITPQSGTHAISGNLSVTAANNGGLTFAGNTNDPTMNVTGDLSWSQFNLSTGTVQTTSGANTWTVSGSIDMSPCYFDDLAQSCYSTESGNTLVMNGTSKTLTGLAGILAPTLQSFTNSGTITLVNSMTVANTFLISSGTFTSSTGTLTISGNIFRNNATFTHGSGTVSFTGSAPVLDGSSDTAFYNLTITPSGSDTVTVDTDTGADDPSVANTLNITSSDTLAIETGRTVTFNSGAHTFTFSGIINGAGLFIYKGSNAFPSTGTMTADVRLDATDNDFSVTGTRSFGGDVEIYNTSNSNARTITFGTAGSQTITLSATLSLTRTGSQGVTLDLTAQDPTVSVAGDATINTGTTLSLSDSSSLTLTGSYLNAGTLTHNGSGATTGSVIFNASSGTKTIDSTGASSAAFNDLTLNDAGGPATFQLESALDVDDDLTITGGTLDTKATEDNAIAIAGNWTNNDTFTTDGGTVTADGAAQQTFSGTLTGATGKFYNLTITNNSGVDPDASPSVIFSSDAETANNFTASTAGTKLRFNAAGTYTFQNIVFSGTPPANRITLRSSTPDTQWNLNVAGTRSVQGTDAKDSDACGQAPDIDATHISNKDSGNDDCWDFVSLTFTLSSNSINLGTLASAAVSTASHTIRTIVTSGNGYTSLVYDDGNLRNGGNDINDVGDGAVTAGSEEYGLATSDASQTISQDTDCSNTPFTSSAITTTQQSVAGAGAGPADETSTICYAASISGTTPPATYSQVVTYITVGLY